MNDAGLALSLAGLAFMMTVIWGGPLLRILRHFKIGKQIRVEEPGRHFVKMGTPTMGGVMIILPVALITVMLNAVNLIGMRMLGRSVLVPLAAMLGYALLGALDDWEGVRGKRKGEGMRIRTKLVFQVVLALLLAAVLKYVLGVPDLYIPGIDFEIELGWLYIPIAGFVIVAMSNAVNFTDGLDGLAGMISATIFATYGGVALMQGQVFIARFCFTMVGALFGFLWFNVHPAQLFMGDTGSLSLGATIAVIALMTGQWAILPVIAVIPVSEALSDVIQIGYFRITHGRRFFKMAPLHLHFELLGWSEMQIVAEIIQNEMERRGMVEKRKGKKNSVSASSLSGSLSSDQVRNLYQDVGQAVQQLRLKKLEEKVAAAKAQAPQCETKAGGLPSRIKAGEEGGGGGFSLGKMILMYGIVALGAAKIIFSLGLADSLLPGGASGVPVAVAEVGRTPEAAALPAARDERRGSLALDASAVLGEAHSWTKSEKDVLTQLDLRRVELERRKDSLDKRESDLNNQTKALADRLTELRALSSKLSETRKDRDRHYQGRLEQLANVYGAMEPQEAAQLIAKLDDTISLQLLERLPEKRMGQVLGFMEKERAVALTKMLTEKRNIE